MLMRSAILLPFAVLSMAFAQNALQPASENPTFHTQARDVIVDVVVTDEKGAPVTGLKSFDFQVLENGKLQAIDFFEEHTAKALPPGANAPMPATPPNVYTNVPPAPESDAVDILMLDTLNTPQQEFANSRKQVIQFLQSVKPGTRMAILTLGDKLSFVQNFTDDPAKLLAALQDPKNHAAQGAMSTALVTRSEEAEINTTIANRQNSFGGASSYGIQAINSAFAQLQDFSQLNRSMMTLEALQGIARYLANIPGRKNLLWFSTEFPVFLLPNESERGTMRDLSQPLSVVRKTADMLTAARIAVYPIQAAGLMNDSWFLADAGGPGNTPVYTGGANSPTMGVAAASLTTGSLMADASRRAIILQQMHQLADDTGGKAIYNNNDLAGAASHAIDDGSRYYTLTYSPANKKLDGSYREIKIKATDKHWKLSWRRGYNADQPDQRALQASSEPLHPLMLMGLPNASEILYGIRVLPAAQQPAPDAPLAGKNDKLKGPFRRLAVDFFIRWSDLKFVPGPGDTHKADLQIEVLAYDRNGTAINWTGGTLLMKLSPDTWASIQKSGVPTHLEIDVPRDQDVVLSTGIYDYGASRAGTLQVDAPAHQETAKALPQ